MKLTKNSVQGIMDSAIAEREKGRVVFERQQGVINLCQWMLQNCELEEESKGASNVSDGIPGPQSDTIKT